MEQNLRNIEFGKCPKAPLAVGQSSASASSVGAFGEISFSATCT